jgi:hypothetical protein
MNYKEVAERLASCGLTPNTFGAVAKELIYSQRLINDQQCPNPESQWQFGFGDGLRWLEQEAMKVSAELQQTHPPSNPYKPGSLEWGCWNEGYRTAKHS